MDAINANAPRFWALGILSSLLLNLCRMQSWHKENVLSKKASMGPIDEVVAIASDKAGRRVALDCIQDTVDLVIPLSMMGMIEASPGMVGLAGTLTSLIGASAIWPK